MANNYNGYCTNSNRTFKICIWIRVYQTSRINDLYAWNIFTVAAGYTLLYDEHVRVDSFYRESSKKFKNVVNLIGTLTLLMPFIIVTFLMSYPYVIRSWKILEGSPETSGLNATYIYKTTLIIFPILLFIQALVILFSSINNLKTKK